MLKKSETPATTPESTDLVDFSDIRAWLRAVAGIPPQKIRLTPTGHVDVMMDVDLRGKLGDLKKIPVRFGVVHGSFNCSENQLTTLTNAPRLCYGWFSCNFNRLRSLRGAPVKIQGNLYADHNDLLTLKGVRHVGGVVQCQANPNLYDTRPHPEHRINFSALIDWDLVNANADVHRVRIRLARAARQSGAKDSVQPPPRPF